MGLFNFSRSNSRGRAARGKNPEPSSRGHRSDALPESTRPPKPRKEARYTVPIFSIKIRAEFFVGEQRYVGYLWDVSLSGACVRSSHPIPASGRVQLCLHDHGSEEMLEREATLLWSDEVMNAHYAGFCFDEPFNEDDCGFLRTLLNLPSRPQTSRLSRLGPIRINPWPV